VILEGKGRGKYSKYAPFAFTQEGVAMLSSVHPTLFANVASQGLIYLPKKNLEQWDEAGSSFSV
jgi:hypothetical protein